MRTGPRALRVHILHFEEMSLVEQVRRAASLDVLIGVNGAGLINGLFLPPHAVAMQIIPWESKLNHDEFARVLRSRGPYTEWTNKWKENAIFPSGDPQPHMNQDTFVDPDEFRATLLDALEMIVPPDPASDAPSAG